MVHRSMKRIRFLTAFIVIVLMAGCAKDEDIAGDARDKFIGSWTCKEIDPTGASSTFTVTFSKVGVADSMRIANFADLGNALVIVNENALVFPAQNIEGFNLTNGSGNYANGKITMTYKLDNETYTAECKR
jgi:hypothetical protein